MAAGGLQLPALVQRIIVDASGASTAEKQVGGFAGKANSHFASVAKGALALAGAGGIAAIGKSVITSGIDFTKSMNSMAAVAGVPAPELEKLRALAMKMGADTVFSAGEAAAGMLELAKSGITTSDIMGGALKNSLDLATAGELDLATASTVVGQAMNTFNLTGKDSQRIVDALAGAANASSADVSDLSMALSQGGQAAAMAGWSIEETTGALALFADNGLRGCYDGETEVLTRQGFQKWHDVTEDTEFATMNPETDELEYQRPSRLVRYRHTGKMYEVSNANIDLLVTPDHRMWVQPMGPVDKPPFQVMTAEDVQGRHVRYRAGGLGWQGDDAEEHVLPGFSQPRGPWTKEVPEKRIPADAWAAFMGYYLSEGSRDYHKGCYRVSIAQKDGPKKDRMLADLQRLGFTVHVGKRALVILSEQLYRAVEDQGHCHEKHVPDYIKGWSPRLLETFWMAFCLGDGTEDGAACWTTSPALRDGLSEVILKCGWSPHVRRVNADRKPGEIKGRPIRGARESWKVSANCHRLTPAYNPSEYRAGTLHADRHAHGPNHGAEGWVDFDDEVFCATVPNHLLIVRRNGKTVVSGNSDAGTSLKTSLLALVPSTDKAKEAMAKYGLEFVNQDGSIKNLMQVQAELREGLGGLTDAQQQSALKTIFGTDAYRAMGTLLNSTEAELQTYIDATSKVGTASEVAAARMKGLPGVIEGIKGGLETLGQQIYSGIEPALVRLGTTFGSALDKISSGIGALPPVVTQVVGGVATFGATAATAAGLVSLLGTQVSKGRDALEKMGAAGHLANRGIGVIGTWSMYGAVIMGLVAAGNALVDAMAGVAPGAADVRSALVLLAVDAASGSEKLAGTSSSFKDLGSAIDTLVTGVEGGAGPIGAFFTDVFGGSGPADVQKAAEAIEVLDQELAALVTAGHPDIAAQSLANLAQQHNLTAEQVEALKGKLDAYSDAQANTDTMAKAGAISAGMFAEAQGKVSEQVDMVTTSAELSEEQLKALEETYKALGDSVTEFVNPSEAFQAVLSRNEEAAKAHAQTIADSTADSKDSWEDYASQSGVSLAEFTAELDKQIASYDAFADNLLKIAGRGRADVAAELAAMGQEGAVLAAEFVTLTDDKFTPYADTLVEAAQKKPEQAGQNLQVGLAIMTEIAKEGGARTVEGIMTALGPMPGLTEELVRETAARANAKLEEGEPSWGESWNRRRWAATGAMDEVKGIVPATVAGVSADTNTIVANGESAFAQSWLNRKTSAQNEMGGMRDTVPPVVAEAGDTVNRYLTERYPEFEGQWGDRNRTSVEQMNALLRDAPPPVRAAMDLINEHSRSTMPTWAESMAERNRSAWGAMDQTRREVPPLAYAAGVGMKDMLWASLGAFKGVVGDYQSSLVNGISTVSLAARGSTGGIAGGASAIPKANGGIVEFFAQGGMKEKHKAQIARAGDWRVWAEPETGGEAYIPLAQGKRQRSTAILAEVARRFGMSLRDMRDMPRTSDYHDGGLYVPPPRPGLPTFGPPPRPAGEGTMHNMREFVAEWARQHMNEPHHQAPPPGSGGGGALVGGKALDRVRSVIGEFAGARITSTYRSPSQNAAVGGAKNSLHMDKNNPAVDIGGPTSTLDRMHGRLRGMGGWRELLWRVRGHYDHIHAAKEGAIFSRLASGGRALANKLQLVGENGAEMVIPKAPMLTLDQERTARVLGEQARAQAMGVALSRLGGAAGGTGTTSNSVAIGEGAVQLSISVTGADDPEMVGRVVGGSAARQLLAILRAA